MSALPRKKSPRFPSLALDEALERALRIYKAEGLHAMPLEVAAKHLGYSGSKNGAALSTLAALGYYGLFERNKEGRIAITKGVESFQYAPEEAIKKAMMIGWLKKPAVFADLLNKYPDRLPSDSVLRYDLIQLGFIPTAADACVNAFRRSVEVAGIYNYTSPQPSPFEGNAQEEVEEDDAAGMSEGPEAPLPGPATPLPPSQPSFVPADRIPVRLSGNRRAWIEIPSPFYEADKTRLKAQIDLLLADDEL